MDATDERQRTLEGWYHDHFVELARLGALACGDRAVAEDAVQEVFADMLRRPPTLRDPARPLGYLRTAVLNRCRSTMRRRTTGARATLRSVAGDADVHEHVEHDAVSTSIHHEVLAAVRSLPDRQRDVVLLRHWLGLSEAEIAETLGISPGTVKSAASRARASLAPLLEDLR